jgi:hypothetical protein
VASDKYIIHASRPRKAVKDVRWFVGTVMYFNWVSTMYGLINHIDADWARNMRTVHATVMKGMLSLLIIRYLLPSYGMIIGLREEN